MSSVESRARIVAVAGVAVLAIGVVDFLRTASFVLRAESAQAVVVTGSSRGNGQYRMFEGYPEVVRFSDLDGIEHTATVIYGTWGRHPPGTKKEVLYKAFDPAGTARYGDFGQLWMLSIVLMLMGTLFLTVSSSVRNRGY